MKRHNSISIKAILLLSLIAGCGTPTPDATAFPSSIPTKVTIDGSGNDWPSYPISGTDQKGDQVSDAPDIGEVRAFCDDQYFYLYIRLNAEGVTDHYDVIMDVDGDGTFDYQISFWAGTDQANFAKFPVTGGMQPVTGVISAQGDVIEMRMPLSLVGGNSVRSIQMQNWMDGITGDTVDPMPVAQMAEKEPGVVAVVEATPTIEPPTPSLSDARIAQIKFQLSGVSAENIYTPPVRPVVVQIGPKNEILVLGDGENIQQLNENGDVSLYAFLSRQVHDQIDYFAFDPSGRLWFSTNHSGIYRMKDDGTAELVIRGVGQEGIHRVFAFNSKGMLYAVDHPSFNVHRVTSNGEATIIAEGFGQAHNIAIGPNDEVLVVEESRGELVRIFDDGTWKVITDGLGVDQSIVVAPDGTVFLFEWKGIIAVDLATGKKTNLDWYQPYSNTGEKAVIDRNGRMYTYHPNMPIYQVDFQTHTVKAIFNPRGNSWAMSVGPASRVFVAYGDRIPGGETTLYEVIPDNTLKPIATFPFREPLAMTFDSSGKGYLAVFGPSQEYDNKSSAFYSSTIYTFDPNSGNTEVILDKGSGAFNSLAIDPTSGFLWWSAPDGFQMMDAAGKITKIPRPESGARNTQLSFDSAGKLYAFQLLPDTSNLEVNWRIYTRASDGNWNLLHDEHISMNYFGSFAICPGDTLYVLGATRESKIHGRDLVSALWRVEPDGSFTTLAYDIGMDDFAASCDNATGALYHTHIDGIDRYLFAAP